MPGNNFTATARSYSKTVHSKDVFNLLQKIIKTEIGKQIANCMKMQKYILLSKPQSKT